MIFGEKYFLNSDEIKARNTLIPIAEKYTDETMGKPPRKPKTGRNNKYEIWANNWNLVYHDFMNELAKGLNK